MPSRQINDFFTKRKQKKIELVTRPVGFGGGGLIWLVVAGTLAIPVAITGLITVFVRTGTLPVNQRLAHS